MFQSGFVKLIFVAIIIFLLVKFHQEFFDAIVSSSDITKKLMTKYEIDNIEHQIFLDYSANEAPFPPFSEFEWRDYVRKIIKSSRDPSIDLWGTPLQIRQSSTVSVELPDGIMIRSAGPDKIFYNDDDIYAVCKKRVN